MSHIEIKRILKQYGIKSSKVGAFLDLYTYAKKHKINYPMYYAITKMFV